MNTLILVRVGNYHNLEGKYVQPAEQERVGKLVGAAAALRNINLKATHIITTNSTFAQETAFGIASVNDLAEKFDHPYVIETDGMIFNSLPEKQSDISSYQAQVDKALIRIRGRITQLGTDKNLIVVGHLPTVWGIYSRLDPGILPEYSIKNYPQVHEKMANGATYTYEFS